MLKINPNDQEDEATPEIFQFIIRMPPGASKEMREAIRAGSEQFKDRLEITLNKDLRNGQVRFDNCLFDAKMVDLPTNVESYVTFDSIEVYKSADISHILICKEKEEHPITEVKSPCKTNKNRNKKYRWPHGITPPLKNVRKRRFRKLITMKVAEILESEKLKLYCRQMEDHRTTDEESSSSKTKIKNRNKVDKKFTGITRKIENARPPRSIRRLRQRRLQRLLRRRRPRRLRKTLRKKYIEDDNYIEEEVKRLLRMDMEAEFVSCKWISEKDIPKGTGIGKTKPGILGGQIDNSTPSFSETQQMGIDEHDIFGEFSFDSEDEERRPSAEDSRHSEEDTRPLAEDSCSSTKYSCSSAEDSRPAAEDNRHPAEDNRPLAEDICSSAKDNCPSAEDICYSAEDNRHPAEDNRPLAEDICSSTKDNCPSAEDICYSAEDNRHPAENNRPLAEDICSSAKDSGSSAKDIRPSGEDTKLALLDINSSEKEKRTKFLREKFLRSLGYPMSKIYNKHSIQK